MIGLYVFRIINDVGFGLVVGVPTLVGLLLIIKVWRWARTRTT